MEGGGGGVVRMRASSSSPYAPLPTPRSPSPLRHLGDDPLIFYQSPEFEGMGWGTLGPGHYCILLLACRAVFFPIKICRAFVTGSASLCVWGPERSRWQVMCLPQEAAVAGKPLARTWPRFMLDLVMEQIWSGFGTDLVWFWIRSGLDLAQIWYGFGADLV